MSEAAKRTKTWRAQKQEDGYQPVTVWIPGRIKELAVKLAFQQHHDLSVVVADALQAYVLAKGVKPSTLVDMKRIEALMDQKIAEALASQRPTPAPAAPGKKKNASGKLPEAIEPLPPVPEGMKQCRKGHLYPASKKECPQCVTARKKSHRQRKANKRRGAVPTA